MSYILLHSILEATCFAYRLLWWPEIDDGKEKEKLSAREANLVIPEIWEVSSMDSLYNSFQNVILKCMQCHQGSDISEYKFHS